MLKRAKWTGSIIERGVSSDPASTVDVAPTLARLTGIEIPGDLDGRMLIEPAGRR